MVIKENKYELRSFAEDFIFYLEEESIEDSIDYGLDLELFYLLVDFKGEKNKKLCNPLNYPDFGSYSEERRVPLSQNTEISGDFLCIKYYASFPKIIIEEFDTASSLEAHLLKPYIYDYGTILTSVLPFLNGIAYRFKEKATKQSDLKAVIPSKISWSRLR